MLCFFFVERTQYRAISSSAPKRALFMTPGVRSFRMRPFSCPSIDHGTDEVQVFDERLVDVLLHEFRALANLHPKNLREMLLLGDDGEVGDGKPLDLLQGIFFFFQLCPHVLHDLSEFFLKEGDEDIVLVLEVQVNRPVGDIRLFGDLRYPGIVKPLLRKNLYRSLQDLLMLILRLS